MVAGDRIANKLLICLMVIGTVGLAACSDSGGSRDTSLPHNNDPNPDAFTYKTGATEPLFAFQWALDYDNSYFQSFPAAFHGGIDLNVAEAHASGYKGQGVNVLVLDTGVDLNNEDLKPNADASLSWNFVDKSHNPHPVTPDDHDGVPHGTAVAGMIAAAQNGRGIMGIAPRVKLGGANFLETGGALATAQAYGGAGWSEKADVFNASYGLDNRAAPYDSFRDPTDPDLTTPIVRGLKTLREGHGAVFIKAAGNSFLSDGKYGKLCGISNNYYACVNPANDPETLEPNIIVVAALDTLGRATSYSSAGSVLWVTGMAGEFGNQGVYGELPGTVPRNGALDGPTIFTTDLSGCAYGYSYASGDTPFLRGETVRDGQHDNRNCDYSYMNGTSAAAPTLAGVAALIVGANPKLSWRDVRDIFRLSARPVDEDYPQRIPLASTRPYGAQMDLTSNGLLNVVGDAKDIVDGSTVIPVDLGWQKNAAGRVYSNRYGFGVPDTALAIVLAKLYQEDNTVNPQFTIRRADVQIPAFQPAAYWYKGVRSTVSDADIPGITAMSQDFPYQKVSSAGKFSVGTANLVDAFQVRLGGEHVCLGSFGVAVKSPAGTISLLKLPNDHFQAGELGETLSPRVPITEFWDYGLGSFAFYGEGAAGDWEIFILASNPDLLDSTLDTPMTAKCPSKDAGGAALDYEFLIEARVITQ